MDERVKAALANLPEDIRDQVLAATSREEIKEIVDNYDGVLRLSEDELEWVSGGCSDSGDSRDDFDSSRISQGFLSGEDLGF